MVIGYFYLYEFDYISERLLDDISNLGFKKSFENCFYIFFIVLKASKSLFPLKCYFFYILLQVLIQSIRRTEWKKLKNR